MYFPRLHFFVIWQTLNTLRHDAKEALELSMLRLLHIEASLAD